MAHGGSGFTLFKAITNFTHVQQSEALQDTLISHTFTSKHSFDHMKAHIGVLTIGS